MKTIKKGLLAGKIRITSHATDSMRKRGYSRSDMISCIWSGEITDVQVFQQKLQQEIRFTVEGKDMDNLPIVLIVGKDHRNPNHIAVITVMPPIKSKFKRTI